jgi:hypothetical protein
MNIPAPEPAKHDNPAIRSWMTCTNEWTVEGWHFSEGDEIQVLNADFDNGICFLDVTDTAILIDDLIDHAK